MRRPSARRMAGADSPRSVESFTVVQGPAARVLAGSRRYANHWLKWGRGRPPAGELETESGDLTLHVGDVRHSSPPPTCRAAGRQGVSP